MKNRKSFAIHTLGCKLNFSESSDISRQLIEQGFVLSEQPDYLLINTCAVTGAAEKKARNLVAKLHRQHPNAEIIIFGCYSALSPDIIAQWQGVKAVLGSADKMNIIPYMTEEVLPQAPHFFSSYSSHDRTRSFLKIQDGCDYHCTYCTVATARGESRSDNIDHVLQNIETIHRENIKEIIITGVNLGDFGRKNGSSFLQLLEAIEKQDLIERIRISSIEPNLLTPEIIALAAQSKRVMPHFHIPLQSGSDRILGLMKRRYNRQLFAAKIEEIKKYMPEACVAVDIIAGFPGETNEDFQDTYDFLNSLPISYLHVFTYSKRPGTPAAAMTEQVSPPLKKERTNQLLNLSTLKKEQFYREHYGEERPVLIESDIKNGWLFGFSDNYIKVKVPFNASLINTITPVQITQDTIEPE